MLNTRTLRFVVPVVALITIIYVIATSYGSISSQLEGLKDKAESGAFASFDESNTLQGKPHDGAKAPYSSNSDNKVIADTSDSEKSHAEKAKPGSAGEAVPNKADAVKEDTKSKPDAVQQSKGKPPVSGSASKGPGCTDRDFVVMIDAGSSGSRVHVYEFDTCQSPPILIKETFEMLKPGLSSYDTDTVGAAKSLDKLLDVAVQTVPKDKQGCTPVAVKATAGLRLLGEEKSKNILAEVRSHLENDYPFAVVEGDGISIMDGSDEGVYAWITANYLLGNIGSSEKNPTAAIFDLGGGSTQIVFEPEFQNDGAIAEGDHKYDLSFGSRDFTLYQHSHLGYGLFQGRNKINGLVVESELQKNTKLQASKFTSKKDLKGKKAEITLSNPCISPGLTATDVEVEIGKDEYYLVNMQGPAVDSNIHTGANCRFLAEKILNNEAECTEKPCSFNGIYQPSLTKSFAKENDLYVFSFFYDRTNPLGFPKSFTVGELSELAKVVCGGESLWASALLDKGIKELSEEPQWCLDLSFITALLHTGYDLPLHRELRTAQTINNNELGWCLGASLPLLDKKGWTCRVKNAT